MAVLLLKILFCYLSFVFVVLVCSMQPCGHLLGKGLSLGSLVFDVLLCLITFLCGVLGQMWYLIVLIPDFSLLTYLIVIFAYHIWSK